ncbi:MAG: 4Fe-4S binding protein [Kineosporiaceae bacterium]|nr:4Fe-4S binding protein [Kineosporiaceae bacterium]
MADLVTPGTPPSPTPASPARVTVARRTPGWSRRVRWARRAVQALVVGGVGWLVFGHATGGSSAESFCPFGGFETLWTLITTGRTVPHTHLANVVLAAAVIGLALTVRGAFCGWLCPLGSLQEWLHGVTGWLASRVPPLRRLRRRLEHLAAGRAWRRTDRVLRWGRWLVLAWAVIGAAVTGTMVFREADPWIALISVVEFELSLAFAVLVATTVLAVFVERPFCRYACPLGAVQAALGALSPVAVQRDAAGCLGCDLCNRACPMAIPVNTRTRVTDTSCIGCLDCVAACPSAPALGVTLALPVPLRSPR